jgi:hypothetical protein
MPAPYPDQSSLGDYIGQSTPINITGPFPGLGYVTSTSSMNTVPNGTTGQHLVMGISGTPEWETETTTFNFVGDTGITQTVDHGDTISFNGSNLIKTTSAATDVLDISLDVTGATTGQVVKFDGTNAIWSNDSITGGTPTEIVYIDNAGVGTSDALATRDSVTNETYIGYRTSGGDFSNGFHLGNILGGALSDGAAFQRHDAVNDNFTFIGAIDGTPIGLDPNTLTGGYIDFTNSIFATHGFSEGESALDYSNSITGTGGSININDTDASISYTDNGNSFQVQTRYTSGGIETQYNDINNNTQTQLFTGNGFISGGDRFGTHNSMTFNLDDNSQQFYVKGLKNGVLLGDMLNLDALSGIMRLGDTTKISSQVYYEVNDTNATATVHGLQTIAPNWTPSTLSDGFTGTGLNDMHYDSTTTYTGTYPKTYTSTISAVNCVRLQIYSITTPGFAVGDTVTDLATSSTGTILSGGDAEGILIIQPIVDNGWNTATQVDDITSSASSLCIFNQYTDTFDWNDGTTFVTYKDTNTFVPLNDGLSVGFYNFTGHTIGDSWEFTMLQGTSYSKMALFDGTNRTISIGDADHSENDVYTDWILGTGNSHGIYHHLADAQEYYISNSVGNILVLDSDTFNQTVIFSIEDPFNGQTPFSVEAGDGAYGFGFHLFDAGPHLAVLGAEGTGNNTFLKIDDDAETITLNAAHISSPLSAYDDDADAGSNGVIAGELYQTTGAGASPLNVAGIVMIKQ